MLIDVAYLKKAKQLHWNIERAKLEKAYAKRAKLIEEIQSQINSTMTKGIKSGKLDAKEMNKLKRQMKAVVSTDPTAYKSHDAWKKSVLKPEIEGKLQAHHKLGLDDYVDYMIDMDTDELIDFHSQAAKKGYYFGNHPKNLEWLPKDQHVGQGTRLASGRDAVHGRYEHTRLDRYKAKDLSGADQFAEFVHGNTDIGQPGSFDQIPRKRLDVPENIRDLPFNEKIDKSFYFAAEDMKSIELTKATPRKPQIIKGRSNQIPVSVKQQVINVVPPDKYTPELLDALENKQWKVARDLGKRFIDTTSPLLKTTTGLSRAESAVRIAGGDYIGGVAGLAMTTPTFQKQVGKLLAKQGIKLIPGMSLGSGALQAIGYVSKGQWTKAGLSAVGGVIGEFGPAGDAVQAAIDLGLTGHDVATGDINYGLELEDELEEANLLKKGTKNIRSVARNL